MRESKIMQRASEKRQLEALVIAKGKCSIIKLHPIRHSLFSAHFPFSPPHPSAQVCAKNKQKPLFFPVRQIQGTNRWECQSRRGATDHNREGGSVAPTGRRAYRSRAEHGRWQTWYHQRCRAGHAPRSS